MTRLLIMIIAVSIGCGSAMAAKSKGRMRSTSTCYGAGTGELYGLIKSVSGQSGFISDVFDSAHVLGKGANQPTVVSGAAGGGNVCDSDDGLGNYASKTFNQHFVTITDTRGSGEKDTRMVNAFINSTTLKKGASWNHVDLDGAPCQLPYTRDNYGRGMPRTVTDWFFRVAFCDQY